MFLINSRIKNTIYFVESRVQQINDFIDITELRMIQLIKKRYNAGNEQTELKEIKGSILLLGILKCLNQLYKLI